MKAKATLVPLLLLALPALAAAQTKFSGTVRCGKPEPLHTIPVGERTDHAFLISRQKCAWREPLEIAGTVIQDYVETTFTETRGPRASGYLVDVFPEGEFRVRFQGTATPKEGAPEGQQEGQQGRWSFAGGSGKFRGIKGGGTYKCTPTADAQTCDIEGAYELPSPARASRPGN